RLDAPQRRHLGRSPDRSVSWDDPLSRLIVLMDGTELAMLRDGLETRVGAFGRTRWQRERAIELPVRAAETGKADDIPAATRQLTAASTLRQLGRQHRLSGGAGSSGPSAISRKPARRAQVQRGGRANTPTWRDR